MAEELCKWKVKPKVITQGIQEEFTPDHINIFMKDGLEMLKKPNPEDSEFFKLRVISKEHEVWIIEDGCAITLLKPDEY